MRGTLILEGLRVGSTLTLPDLACQRIRRVDMSAQPGELPIWTFLDFEIQPAQAAEVAKALADALETAGGWYANYGDDKEHYVIFAGRVFRYRPGDHTGRAEAVAYGLSIGVPAQQLDWKD